MVVHLEADNTFTQKSDTIYSSQEFKKNILSQPGQPGTLPLKRHMCLLGKVREVVTYSALRVPFMPQ